MATKKSAGKEKTLKSPPVENPEAPAATAADHQRARTAGTKGTAKKSAGTKSTKSTKAATSKTAGGRTPPVEPPEAPAATAADHQRAMMGDRDQMIRQAAYYRAESRGFEGGDPEQDWLEAEAEVDEKMQQQEQT